MLSRGGAGVIRATAMKNEAVTALLVTSEPETFAARPVVTARRDRLRRWPVPSETLRRGAAQHVSEGGASRGEGVM